MSPSASAVEVVGVGFGRTGTASTMAALNALGFGPCYHMLTLLSEPARLGPWTRALETGTPDWDEIFDGFRSTLDWPAMTWWESLADEHPDAKVILTVRDPDRWYDSLAKTVLWSLDQPGGFDEMVPAMRTMILERSLEGVAADRAAATDLFRRHTERVRAHVDPGRLLVFEVTDGWAPLCAFLGVPVPDGPFPHLNDADGFRARHEAAR